jgi:Uma2 family endonuclease
VATTPTKLMTFAEFEQLPEEGRRHELCHGEPKERPVVKWGHLIRLEKLRGLLAEAVGDAGLVVTEFSFRPVPEYEGRIADVAYAAKERVERVDPKGYFMGSPDLVIEILSPSNTVAEMREKKKLCLENGSEQFWEVDLDWREVEVSTQDGHAVTYRMGQSIPLFFAPGKSLAVDAIFA